MSVETLVTSGICCDDLYIECLLRHTLMQTHAIEEVEQSYSGICCDDVAQVGKAVRAGSHTLIQTHAIEEVERCLLRRCCAGR